MSLNIRFLWAAAIFLSASLVVGCGQQPIVNLGSSDDVFAGCGGSSGLINRGLIRLELSGVNSDPEAVANLEAGLETFPACGPAYIGLGLASCRRHAYDEGIAYYGRALANGYRRAEVYYNRGQCYWVAGKLDLAVLDYFEAIRLRPDDADALRDLAGVRNQQHKFVEAIPLAMKAILIAPHDVEALHFLGIAYEETGRHDEAIATYDIALKFGPEVADIHYNKGVALMRKKLYDLAIAEFSQATELDPRMVDAFVLRGYSYCRKGMPERARAELSSALELQPDHADAADILRGIDRCPGSPYATP